MTPPISAPPRPAPTIAPGPPPTSSSSEANRRERPDSMCSTRPRKQRAAGAVSRVNWTTNDLDAESGKPPPPGPLPVPARSPPTTARGYLEPRAGVLKGTGKISEIGIAPQDPAAPASGPQRPEQHMGGLQVGGLEALAERLVARDDRRASIRRATPG